MVTDILKLEFKKDEIFLNNHIYISKSGSLYMTDEFASYLCGKDLTNLEIKHFHTKGHYILYGEMNYYCTLSLRKFGGLQTPNYEKFKYYLCGSSGSHGFGGMQHTKRETLGIRTVRRANKYIVDQYLKSKLPRLEKIKKIKERMGY